MPARRPNLTVAAAEFGFVLAALGAGFADALWLASLVAFAALAYWSWTRRVALNRMPPARWAILSLISVAVIIGLLAGAYWLGMAVRGNMG